MGGSSSTSDPQWWEPQRPERLGLMPRLGIVLAAGLLAGFIAALVTALIGAGSNVLTAATVSGVLAIAIAYLFIGPGKELWRRCVAMIALGVVVLGVGVILYASHTSMHFAVWIGLEGLSIIFILLMGLVFGPGGDDSDTSAGEGGGPGF